MRVTVLMILVILASSSTAQAEGRGERSDDGYLFGATYMTMNNPFFVALHESISEAAGERGARTLVLNPDYDQILQIAQVEDLISRGIDALFLNPVDWKGVRPALEEAARAGVPVFVVDAPVYDQEMVVSTIVSNNREAGRLAALDLLELRDGGNVVILDHPTNKPSIDRVDGFTDVLSANPGFRIVAQFSAFGTLEKSLPHMENALQAFERVDVVFGSNDPTSLGAIAGLVAAKRLEGTLVYSVDGSPEGKDMVRSGMMRATSAQSPIAMGRQAVDIAFDYLSGKDVPGSVFVPVRLITLENVDRFPEGRWQ